MEQIYTGAHTAYVREPVAVFLIGMSINRWRAVHKWWPVIMATRPMLRELARVPDKGLLHSRWYWSGRTILFVQYWRNFEQLEKFARSADDPHLPAWRRYNQQIAKSGIVGVFHETYLVQPDRLDAIYVNMPAFGLGRATYVIPVHRGNETARRRFDAAAKAPGAEGSKNDRPAPPV